MTLENPAAISYIWTMANRRDILKGLLASPLAPAAAYAADNRDPFGVYDSDGNLLYMRCKVCPNLADELLPHGVVVIRAQSLEPFEVHVTSEHIEASFHNCDVCGATYHKNDAPKIFTAHGQVGGVLPVIPNDTGYKGLCLILPSNNSATITIRHMSHTPEGLPVPGEIIRQFPADEITHENKYMGVYV